MYANVTGGEGHVQRNSSRYQSSFSGTWRGCNRRRLYHTVGAVGSAFVSRYAEGIKAAYPAVLTAWRRMFSNSRYSRRLVNGLQHAPAAHF